MTRFLVFICTLFAIASAHADDTECKTGWYFNGTECTYCPTGTTTYTTTATECTPCPAGTYGQFTGKGPNRKVWCEPCVAGTYSDMVGATDSTVCAQCPDGTFSVPGSSECISIADTCNPGTYANMNTGLCIACPPGTYATTGAIECTLCPAGTYSDNYGSTECATCPNGAITFVGAISRDECMRILKYLRPGNTNPSSIFLTLKKPALPALAVQIGDDIFYGKMTPVNTNNGPGLYVGYNNQIYQINNNVTGIGQYPFWIETIPNTSEFSIQIIAYGNFTIDWGDGVIEKFDSDSTNYEHSHIYTIPSVYRIGIDGRATGYYSAGKGVNRRFRTISFSDTSFIARISGSLGKIFPTLDTNPSFYGLFANAVNLKGQIPPELFSGITGSPSTAQTATSYGMFESVFAGCSGLTGQIPIGLFGNLSGEAGTYTFRNAFNGCTHLTGATARNPDGTRVYDIEYNGEKWIDAYPDSFTDMYTNSGVSD